MNNYQFKLHKEIYVLFILAALTLFIIYFFKLDFTLADSIYALKDGWYYKEQWFTSAFMHRYLKYAIIALYLSLVVAFFVRNKSAEKDIERYGKVILLVSLMFGTLTVSYLKHTLEVDCPWDLLRYGGDKPFFELFSYGQTFLPSSHCFPSGHASSAFTWLSLYFYTTIFYPKYSFRVLGSVLVLGYILGLGQQFRGAHFLSHDLWSMLVCLIVNVVVYKTAFSPWALKRVMK